MKVNTAVIRGSVAEGSVGATKERMTCFSRSWSVRGESGRSRGWSVTYEGIIGHIAVIQWAMRLTESDRR